jgi:hypothetical protein
VIRFRSLIRLVCIRARNLTDRLRRSKGLFESMYQSGHVQVLAHFAKTIHTLSVNDLRSPQGDVETSPAASRTTGNKLAIEILGKLRSSCIGFPSLYSNGSLRTHSEPKC